MTPAAQDTSRALSVLLRTVFAAQRIKAEDDEVPAACLKRPKAHIRSNLLSCAMIPSRRIPAGPLHLIRLERGSW
ncbi:hypothetical protein GCM10010177_35170 [Actinomadura citrea]|nr:hypothetical protein GCM10010177_35170 [Actinomadura citrea]